MGQTTRSKGISFTTEMWATIDERCRYLKIGRSQYFQMLSEWDLKFLPDIFAHKSDGRWHFFPESGRLEHEAARAAEPEEPGFGKPRRQKR